MAEKFGFGIIGAGVVSEYHARAIEEQSDAKIVAVTSRGREKGEQFAANHKCEYISDLDEMLKRDDIHAVSICTPSGLHAEQAIAAANAGKHIMVDKPMAINLKDATEMIRAARDNNVKLGVIFQKRTEEGPNRVKKAISDGIFGKLIFADASIKYWRNQAYYDSGAWRGTWNMDGGGSSMNQGSHGIDILLYMVGDVEKIYAKTDTMAHNIEVEDVAIAILTYKNGAYGRLQTSRAVNPGQGNRFEFNGTLGTAVLMEDTVTSWSLTSSKEVLAEETIKNAASSTGMAASSSTHFANEGFRIQIANLISSTRTGEKLICSGEDGRKSLQLIMGIYESSKRKEEIYLDELLDGLEV